MRDRSRIEIEYNELLQAMGMESAFDAQCADLTGIAPNDLFISEVKHKTFIKVNEEGTEAAAVTSVGVETTATTPFIVNWPYVFIIHERESGRNLFMGKVKNPVL